MAVAGADAADAMAQVDPIAAARALDRPVVDRERNRIALAQPHHLGTALDAPALLRAQELAAGEIAAGLRQQDGDLQRERELAIEILVQAVVVARAVLQQQRRRTGLSGFVAEREELLVFCRVAGLDPHPLVPE